MINLHTKGGKKTNMKFEWIRTPKDIWESLSKEYPFTLDACASDKNALLNRYWTKKQDALKQSWNDEVIYCHPMYDQNNFDVTIYFDVVGQELPSQEFSFIIEATR